MKSAYPRLFFSGLIALFFAFAMIMCGIVVMSKVDYFRDGRSYALGSHMYARFIGLCILVPSVILFVLGMIETIMGWKKCSQTAYIITLGVAILAVLSSMGQFIPLFIQTSIGQSQCDLYHYCKLDDSCSWHYTFWEYDYVYNSDWDSCCWRSYLGDGHCDEECSHEIYDFDGGDCAEANNTSSIVETNFCDEINSYYFSSGDSSDWEELESCCITPKFQVMCSTVVATAWAVLVFNCICFVTFFCAAIFSKRIAREQERTIPAMISAVPPGNVVMTYGQPSHNINMACPADGVMVQPQY